MPGFIRGSLPPTTNRESLIFEIEFIDADDGTAVDLTDVSMQVKIRLTSEAQWPSSTGYVPFYDYGTADAPCLLATTDNGSIIIPDDFTAVVTFTEAQMRTLCPGQYTISGTVTRDEIGMQMFICDLPVLSGGVPQ